MPRRQRLTREESKARTRSELLRAARRLFLRNGFVDTSLSEIADEAALTKGAVYSNFESKEDLFLALLQEGESGGLGHIEELAPSDLRHAVGPDAGARARAWGRHVAGLGPSRQQVALFLEMNAFALRNPRARSWVAEHNRAFFAEVGGQLTDLLGPTDTEPEELALVAQSLYVGLITHAAFLDSKELDPGVFERAYGLLATLAANRADETANAGTRRAGARPATRR